MIPKNKSVLKRAVGKANRVIRRLTVPSQMERHQEPFATVLPVLVALATIVRVRRAIEFGCGTNSTLSFLRTDLFPDLIELTSVENDSGWRESITRQASDPRLSMIAVEGKVASIVSHEIVEGNQIILVDDSTCAEDRAETIRAVTRVLPDDALLVIHDFEVDDYQLASASVRRRFVCNTLLPSTGVLANQPILSSLWFKRVNRAISKHANTVCPTDVQRWHQIFKPLS